MTEDKAAGTYIPAGQEAEANAFALVEKAAGVTKQTTSLAFLQGVNFIEPFYKGRIRELETRIRELEKA